MSFLILSLCVKPSLQDYYGITFPGPTALSGRDGSLANNPYSGKQLCQRYSQTRLSTYWNQPIEMFQRNKVL